MLKFKEINKYIEDDRTKVCKDWASYFVELATNVE